MVEFEYDKTAKFREGECGHVYFNSGVDASEEPFAKNVKLEAHTEYTSHKNGRIEAPEISIDISDTLLNKKEESADVKNS